jgi:predicted metal-dependent hydrolase
MTALPSPALKYLAGYPPQWLAAASGLLEQGTVGEAMAQRHGPAHGLRNDGALYDFVVELKNRFLRNAGPISKVAYDAKLQPVQHALGLHTRISRVQGKRLTARRQIRVASVFRQAPEPFLRMIVVHELAHLKHAEHDKAFYALCTHMEPDYHPLEFDVRLWLCSMEITAPQDRVAAAPTRLANGCA